MILGFIAVIFAGLNLSKIGTDKYKKYMFLSLAFTALAICSFYSEIVFRINDATYLEDVIIPLGDMLPFVTICSIVINSIPMFVDYTTKRSGGTENV